jgi:hypothetical protein
LSGNASNSATRAARPSQARTNIESYCADILGDVAFRHVGCRSINGWHSPRVSEWQRDICIRNRLVCQIRNSFSGNGRASLAARGHRLRCQRRGVSPSVSGLPKFVLTKFTPAPQLKGCIWCRVNGVLEVSEGAPRQ